MSQLVQSSALREAGGCLFQAKSYPAGLRIREHAHSEPYVCLVLSGSYREWRDDGLHYFSAGTVHYHAPGDRLSAKFGEAGGECLSVSLPSSQSLQGVRECNAITGNLREELVEAYRDPSTSGDRRLADVAAAVRALATNQFPPAWIQVVEGRIRSLSAPSVPKIAEEVGVHPIHLWKSFKRWYRVTPCEYSRRFRIGRSKEMLVSTDLPLSQIASELGFCDESHFIRVFKSSEGMTPSQFRLEQSG